MDSLLALLNGPLKEDLAGNLERVAEIAARCCTDCADYHVTGVANRAAADDGAIEGDRAELIARLAEALRSLPPDGEIRLLVAGSLDTGLLSTVAAGAYTAGPGIAARTNYTVIDRCGTPLELCRHYADRVGLRVTTRRHNVLDPGEFSADIIAVHSLFRFFPKDRHVEVLRRFASWLSSHGAILFSQSVANSDRATRRVTRAERHLRAVEALLASGRQKIGETPQELLARYRRYNRHVLRPGDYDSIDDMRALFAAAGMREIAGDEVRHTTGRVSHRLLSLLVPA
jgi:hypothetical protein